METVVLEHFFVCFVSGLKGAFFNMTAKHRLSGLLIAFALPFLFGCGEQKPGEPTHFTRTDSLTDTFLALQDTMLQTWNMMINDDNQKIDAMHNVIHELLVSGGTNRELLKLYEERLDRLKNIRYTQKSMVNADVVEEYDLATNALVTELIAMAETQRQFAYNPTLQKLVDNIRSADARTQQYREAYDNVTTRYNRFLLENKDFLKDINSDSGLEARPLFRMASEN